MAVSEETLTGLEAMLYGDGATTHPSDRHIHTLPWFVHPEFQMGNGDWTGDFVATGNPDDDSDNYDVFDNYPEAMDLAVAAVNALPELIAEIRAARALPLSSPEEEG